LNNFNIIRTRQTANLRSYTSLVFRHWRFDVCCYS